ncbi:MAG TPA: hypothetical protein VNJ07_07835 [Chitinophagales bacterium]|nr:hypothetical protein [Chitinophagales bacterium]
MPGTVLPFALLMHILSPELVSGFIYMVSRASTTGKNAGFQTAAGKI